NSANYAKRLAKEEGLFVGYSSGSAMTALMEIKDELTADDVVVLLFSDHGTKYLGKIYNEDWMKEQFSDKNKEEARRIDYKTNTRKRRKSA
ncbi:MAG: hypothetical protein AAGI49_03590, partial [Bacteroidota bacterium]